MKLLDFKQDESFDRLRKLIGTDDYGLFELFDPLRHLSWQERQALNKDWLEITSSTLHAYGDKTLAYKNSHVFCLHNESIHFAFCDNIKKNMKKGNMNNVSVTLRPDLISKKTVCHYCLHAISYQGFDVYRNRHKEYNENILKNFNLNDYISEKY